MKLLLIYAHPESRSLNGSLKDFAVAHLKRAGHEIQVSDLYKMHWKAALDQQDAPGYDSHTPFNPAAESRRVFADGSQPVDIEAEQAKLLWADAVIFQFPLWWFSMPAILKGWIERVYAYGFAYGVGEHSERHWGDRYGEGRMSGKRAMLVVTMGGWESHYSGRGVNGALNDVLFPIQHGVLFYPGFTVMPPFPIYKTGTMDAVRFEHVCQAYATRLDNLFTDQPLLFRRQNGGDYEIPALTLKPHLAPGREDLGIHGLDGQGGDDPARC